jgi:two-component system, NtrC family, sensor kinase
MPSEISMSGADQVRHRTLEELERELADAREQQAATAEILASISSSATDINQAFAKIAMSAGRLCDAYDATIHQVDGDLLRLVAHHGPIPVAGSWPLTRGRLLTGAVINRRTIHVADLQVETDEYPEGSDIARRLGYHTILVVPLIRAGVAIGVITIRRTEVRLFSDKQIALLETFANQAVIAIENTRLFEAEQASKREFQDSLAYQTAISEVLGIISRSPAQLQPVFNAIVVSCKRLLRAHSALVLRVVGHQLSLRPSRRSVLSPIKSCMSAILGRSTERLYMLPQHETDAPQSYVIPRPMAVLLILLTLLDDVGFEVS